MQDWGYNIFRYWKIYNHYYNDLRGLIATESKPSNKKIIEGKHFLILSDFMKHFCLQLNFQLDNSRTSRTSHLCWKLNQASAMKCSSRIRVCWLLTPHNSIKPGKISFSCSGNSWRKVVPKSRIDTELDTCNFKQPLNLCNLKFEKDLNRENSQNIWERAETRNCNGSKLESSHSLAPTTSYWSRSTTEEENATDVGRW
jgi:hypothetical protein